MRKLTYLFVCLLALPAAGQPWSGSGTPNDPYQIWDVCDMQAIGANSVYWDAHFELCADINLAGYTYTTALIAPDTDNTNWYFDGTPFTGTFNGNNHIIHNITIDTAGANNGYLGLFGQLRSSAAISNLQLKNVNIIGRTYYAGSLCGSNGDCDLGYAGGTISNCCSNGYVTCGNSSFAVGGMVGYNGYGIISNCYAAGSVNGDSYIGGLVGWNYFGFINDCYANNYMTGEDSSYAVGGLVGCNENGTINNCHTNSDVTGGDNSYAVGGLVGELEEGNINNCYTTGSVNADDTIGNLVGRNYYGSINNCYSAGTVTGESYTVGGLIGYNYRGDIINCYAASNVSGGDNSGRLGGLVGWNEGTINNCYAAGSITGGIGSGYIGGLTGRNGRTITNCYASGTVSSGTGSSNLAGLCGYQMGHYAETSNCFWDTESTSMSVGYNLDLAYPGTITNVFGKTTAQMQDANTYISAGWDFNTPIWKFCSVPDYPSLWWEECPVLEPAELISELLGEVVGLELPSGIENSLMAKLNAALAALEDENENNDAAAVNTLGAFINAVETQRGKKIPEAEADALIAAAQQIIDLLSDG